MQIQEPNQGKHFALFNLGFRPFFLFAALSSMLLMSYWLILLSKTQPGYQYYQLSQIWHGHEMLFGYAVAVIAGFLLTAVRNWTSIQTPYGAQLAGLFLLWLAGRLLPIFAELITPLPAVLIAVTDLLFLPLIALVIGVPVIRSGNYRNLVFVIILLALTLANALIHLQLLGITQTTLGSGLQLGLGLIIVVMIVMGGRVIPFFTERALAFEAKRYRWLEASVIPLAAAWLIADLSPFTLIANLLAALNAAVHLLRLSGWFKLRMLRNPLIWVLHLAYLFIPLGFALKALSGMASLSPYLAIHAFAAGAIGSMTIGMMARVSLGHTARPLKLAKITVVAFILMMISGLIRVFLPLIPELHSVSIHISGGLWVIAWLLFLIPYTPILLQPRLDGQFG
ncbi:NnrS family protein [Amphritea sp. 1_MG-2023]|uniref:NnrS family protein n=1 Tax=Amphritea sp. 1_MG-2023 TaxID=3062670 RepID=UPI0026E18E85|nr:NnrS family protein [Amphritea sp. 1_MG-2023]MDO6564043.1 NnrS family protein [Amphritea sp. 1_MG-2023]